MNRGLLLKRDKAEDVFDAIKYGMPVQQLTTFNSQQATPEIAYMTESGIQQISSNKEVISSGEVIETDNREMKNILSNFQEMLNAGVQKIADLSKEAQMKTVNQPAVVPTQPTGDCPPGYVRYKDQCIRAIDFYGCVPGAEYWDGKQCSRFWKVCPKGSVNDLNTGECVKQTVMDQIIQQQAVSAEKAVEEVSKLDPEIQQLVAQDQRDNNIVEGQQFFTSSSNPGSAAFANQQKEGTAPTEIRQNDASAELFHYYLGLSPEQRSFVDNLVNITPQDHSVPNSSSVIDFKLKSYESVYGVNSIKTRVAENFKGFLEAFYTWPGYIQQWLRLRLKANDDVTLANRLTSKDGQYELYRAGKAKEALYFYQNAPQMIKNAILKEIGGDSSMNDFDIFWRIEAVERNMPENYFKNKYSQAGLQASGAAQSLNSAISSLEQVSSPQPEQPPPLFSDTVQKFNSALSPEQLLNNPSERFTSLLPNRQVTESKSLSFLDNVVQKIGYGDWQRDQGLMQDIPYFESMINQGYMTMDRAVNEMIQTILESGYIISNNPTTAQQIQQVNDYSANELAWAESQKLDYI